MTADGLGLVPHPEWSWWAIRGQLIDGPGYLANYALSAIMAAAVRARIVEVRGPGSRATRAGIGSWRTPCSCRERPAAGDLLRRSSAGR